MYRNNFLAECQRGAQTQIQKARFEMPIAFVVARAHYYLSFALDAPTFCVVLADVM